MWGRILTVLDTSRSTKDQIKDLPVKRRGVHVDDQGNLVVTELRKCPDTGIALKRTITYKA